MAKAGRPPTPGADVRAVLLDAGGVLLDLDYAYVRRLIGARRVEVSIQALSRAEAEARGEIESALRRGEEIEDGWRTYFHLVLARVGVPGPEHDAIIDSLWEAHGRVGLWTVAIDGARSAVDRLLEAGYRVAVISNAEGQVARDLDNAGYERCFEFVIDSELVGVRKPDPAIFAMALERLELPAAHAVYVGDMPAIDVEGATAAGIAPVLVDPHGIHGSVAVPRVSSLGEVPELLTRCRD